LGGEFTGLPDAFGGRLTPLGKPPLTVFGRNPELSLKIFP
jgi:hypothetical protein